MAIASPPSVMVLMELPMASRISTAATRESGMAVKEMKVVRKFQRNRKSTTVTMIPPSRMEAWTLPTARLMKSACWKALVSITTSSGRVARSSSMVDSMALVT